MNENTPFSELLKDYRKRNRYTQEDTAKYLGYSKETITAWECGRRYPALEDFSRLACLMDIDSKDLAQSINKSRVKTRNIALHSLMKNTDENEQLDNAESIINLAWEAWFASKPKQAAREVYKLLPQLDRIHHSNSSSSHSLRIRELVIRCHGLLGAIRLDALENDTALFHYMQAHRLAAEGHDLNQATPYLALIGDTFRRQGEKGKAISYMENAKELAIGTTRATQGHILQLLAYTYADTGREADFERTIRQATDLLAFTGEATDTAKKEFIPFEVYEIRGKASRDLGKPLDALEYLQLAEQALKRGLVTPRWHAVLDISKGQAYCDAGDLTAGIEFASKGFSLAYQCHSPRQMNRVRKLLKKLEGSQYRWEKKVAELKELLYETYMDMDIDE